MKKKLKLILKKSIPYIVSVTVLSLICVSVYFSLSSAKKQIVTYKTEEGQDIFFYIDQAKYEYYSKLTISSDNEIIKLSTDNYEHDFDSTPIYFKNKKKVLLPKEMSVVFTKDSYKQKKINKFSTIELDSTYYIKNKGLNYPIDNAFLYDGLDTYFFLNETEIRIGGYSYKLPPYSYIMFNHNKEVYMYDYDGDFMEYFDSVDEKVYAVCGDYTIDVGLDSIIYQDGQKLLMKNFNFINKLTND